MTSSDVSSSIDTSVAHPARRYNYWLGGKDNFAADRESGDEIEKIYPYIRISARENRTFLQRVVRYLVDVAGIRQFLDVGTGLPDSGNTHDVAQGIVPQCRVVYVDNDPLVLVHARALLTSSPEGETAYIQADLRQPQTIVFHETLRATLDLTQPVAVLLIAVTHFVSNDAAAAAAVRSLVDAMAPGSYLVISHATADLMEPRQVGALAEGGYVGDTDITLRSKNQIAGFFDGLDLIPPGIQIVSEWRPEPGTDRPPVEQVSVYGGVARKPAVSSSAT